MSRPLEPIPTGVAPVLAPLAGIRAVFFDLYGTLLISASGDIGTNPSDGKAAAFSAALAAVGIRTDCAGEEGVRLLKETITGQLALARTGGVDYPEVDIVGVWQFCGI